MNNLKDKLYKRKIARKYKKFKNCSLPYPYWDKKSSVLRWVYYDENKSLGFDDETSLYESLGNVSLSGVTYHYEAKLYSRKNLKQKKAKYELTESHCHSFDEIVSCLYECPESFNIPDKFKDEYSTQELKYLTKVQSYLNAIGLKDYKQSPEITALNDKWQEIDNKKTKSINDYLFLLTYSKKWEKQREKEYLERCANLKAKEYSNYFPLYTNNSKVTEAYLTGKKTYIIRKKLDYIEDNLPKKYLLVNEENRYCAILEVIKKEDIPFKELTSKMVDYKLKGFKNFQEYKDNLFNDYKESASMFNEDFTEDSLITYETIKLIKRF